MRGEEWFIHARHLRRLRLLDEIKTYHHARRVWLAALHRRERLLLKLLHLEQRIARHQAAKVSRHHLPSITFEVDGVWYREVLHRRHPVLPERHRDSGVRRPRSRQQAPDSGLRTLDSGLFR